MPIGPSGENRLIHSYGGSSAEVPTQTVNVWRSSRAAWRKNGKAPTTRISTPALQRICPYFCKTRGTLLHYWLPFHRAFRPRLAFAASFLGYRDAEDFVPKLHLRSAEP